LREVCFSLWKHGFKKFALVLGHGGNYGVMLNVAQELVSETDAQSLVLNWVPAVRSKSPDILGTKSRDGHGGQGETAMILALQPKLARMDRISVPRSLGRELAGMPGIPYGAGILLGGGVTRPVKDYRQGTDGIGIIGDPMPATPEQGNALYEAAAEWLASAIVAAWA
jgi:creatinine amidohydrolase